MCVLRKALTVYGSVAACIIGVPHAAVTPYAYATAIHAKTRATALPSMQAAYHNPAGLSYMNEGLYLDVGYHLMTKTTAVGVFRSTVEDNRTSWCIPNAAVAYVKKDRGAVFATFDLPDGVEMFQYRENKGWMPLLARCTLGLDAVQMGALRALGLTIPAAGVELPAITYYKFNRWWLQGRLGGAFAIHKMISVTSGVVCSHFRRSQSAGIAHVGAVDSYASRGTGWSGFFGFVAGPPDKGGLSVLYATRVIARGTKTNRVYRYSRVTERRIADALMIGLHYRTADGATVIASYRVDFTGERHFGTGRIPAVIKEFDYIDWLTVFLNASSWAALPVISSGNSENYKHRNRHSAAVGLELAVGQFVPLFELSYSSQELYPRAQNPFDPDLARVGVRGGLRIHGSDNMTIETNATYYFFVTDRIFGSSVKLNKTAWVWGAGVTARVY